MQVEIKKGVALPNGQINDRLIITPPIDNDFWLFRIQLHEDQYLNAFPKFMTIGIGFAQEEDWNTNLPYKTQAKIIANHIWHNRKHKEITKAKLIKAIKIIQEEIIKYMKEK